MWATASESHASPSSRQSLRSPKQISGTRSVGSNNFPPLRSVSSRVSMLVLVPLLSPP
uniref:Uncharacterized protein n=1 Tax=Arundo donax TaxID=35708 RepID=A0A0A9BK74_ARUDO